MNNDYKLCKKEQEVQHFFRWDLIEDAEIVGPHHHPRLRRVEFVPYVDRVVDFNNAKYEKNPENCAVAFYNKDNIIERIWNNPDKYLSLLKRFKYVIGLDFSILCNMYYPQQSYNCWRNFVLTYYLQKQLSIVVPNVGFGDSETYLWAFDGIPDDSWCAITTQGCMDNVFLMSTLLNGLHEFVRIKKPKGIIVYGKFPKEWEDKFPIPIMVYPSYSERRWGETNGKR